MRKEWIGRIWIMRRIRSRWIWNRNSMLWLISRLDVTLISWDCLILIIILCYWVFVIDLVKKVKRHEGEIMCLLVEMDSMCIRLGLWIFWQIISLRRSLRILLSCCFKAILFHVFRLISMLIGSVILCWRLYLSDLYMYLCVYYS
jgi:hypothetical protein